MKILITGFGPFLSHSVNPTGWMLQNFSDSSIFPEGLEIFSSQVQLQGKIKEPLDFQPVSKLRQFKINSENCFFHFLTLPVRWNKAAESLIQQTRKDNYDFVLMTGLGRNEFVFEYGALNQGSLQPGYLFNGQVDEDNSPTGIINPQYPLGSALNFNWPQQKLQTELKSFIESHGFSLKLTNLARTDNQYICNEISYRLLDYLAQEKKSCLNGFLHFPQNIQLDEKSLSFILELIGQVTQICRKN